jgi:glycerate-2-kinase
MLHAFLEWAGPRVQGTVRAGGSHPLPDSESVRAAEAALDFARWTDERIALVLLLSGGASAMLAMPAGSLSLADKIAATGALLGGGVPIEGINCVRKHLSAMKGGRLASRAWATLTLAISDVIGPREDDPSVIGSGPGVPDPTTYDDAIRVLQTYSLWDAMPATVRDHLESGTRGEVEETPKPADPRVARATAYVIGGRREAMAAARARAEALGYETHVVSEAVLGEAVSTGPRVVERGLALATRGTRSCIISSGETTVTVRGKGKGGRNQELALSAVRALAQSDRPAVLASVGTDGVDGPTDAAGAIVDFTTAGSAGANGVDLHAALAANDSYVALERLGALVRTGSTGTNVGDLQILLVG